MLNSKKNSSSLTIKLEKGHSNSDVGNGNIIESKVLDDEKSYDLSGNKGSNSHINKLNDMGSGDEENQLGMIDEDIN